MVFKKQIKKEEEVKEEQEPKIDEDNPVDDIPQDDEEEYKKENIEEEHEESEIDDDDDEIIGSRRSRKRKVNEEDDIEDEEEEDNDKEDDQEEQENEGRTERRGRRKKPKVKLYDDDVFDEEGNPNHIENEEVVISNEDPKGKEKIDNLGYLKGGREFRMKTFKLLNHGDQLFMISTEPARLVGFRDSYLLFKTHRTLYKKVCDNDEKADLIRRGLIPNSYKGRAVNLVTARSIFREFGARMIKEGKKVIDDFWEQRAIDNGDIPGEYADPNEIYQKKLANVLGEGISSAGNATPLTATPIVNYQTDHSWMYQIAQQTSEYNHKLMEVRSNIGVKGKKDVYTNLNFYPSLTQPSRSTIEKFDDKTNQLIYEIKYECKDVRRPVTGLSKISQELIDEIDDPEIQKAIIEQQNYEKSMY
ncbi:unnamed protein product [Candida verbasci]|uniref:Chromatin structure-remodeling complex protein RSC7 n=1 Tax=Candida verbasci TaxID=1227364 RepID=A0A9W4TTU0_9ASCO|nr:unnamed protein product [Candida verbasci]